jgi:hypothetical protein
LSLALITGGTFVPFNFNHSVFVSDSTLCAECKRSRATQRKPMKKRRLKQAALRLPADGSQAVSQLAGATGWSTNEALSFIVRAGWNALNGGSDNIPALCRVMTAAIAHHETELAMRKRLAITAGKLRDARSVLAHKTGGAQ